MSKGEQTRERILERAFRLAGREGLEGLSIGALASDLLPRLPLAIKKLKDEA